MNPTRNWLMVVLALGLFAYIFFFERHPQLGPGQTGPSRLFPGFKSDSATSIRVILASRQSIVAERTDEGWMLQQPISCPAHTSRIDGFLDILGQLNRQSQITAREMLTSKQPMSAFGLDPPRAKVFIQQDRHSLELSIGGRTPVGNHVYVQLIGSDGIFFTDTEFLDRLPNSVDDWRDPFFLPLKKKPFNRLTVESGNNLLELLQDPETHRWQIPLTKTQAARANQRKLEALLQELQMWQIQSFLPAEPASELELAGLNHPGLVLKFSQGTNELLAAHFGNSPSNNPALVFARCPPKGQVVLVPTGPFEALRRPFAEFRETRLISEPLAAFQQIEVQADENFVVQKRPDGPWVQCGGKSAPADPELLTWFLDGLASLEIADFVQDMVPDFSGFGFAAPTRRYSITVAQTNATGVVTNKMVRVDFGTNQADKVFTRLWGENSIYTVRAPALIRLPTESFRLLDRQLWDFSTNQVKTFAIKLGTESVKFTRNPAGQWSLGMSPKPLEAPLTNILEETIYRFGKLRAEAWTVRGDAWLPQLGFKATDHRLLFEVEQGGKTQVYAMDLGSQAPSKNFFAAVTRDGQPLIFELKLSVYQLYLELLRTLAGKPASG
jgi:hypothetical protein